MIGICITPIRGERRQLADASAASVTSIFRQTKTHRQKPAMGDQSFKNSQGFDLSSP
jgi:hypothetical protein